MGGAELLLVKLGKEKPSFKSLFLLTVLEELPKLEKNQLSFMQPLKYIS